MIDWVRKIFGGAPSSSTAAKDRLRLVLMTDHLALAPEIIENMKRDLIDVISRYVEVDRDKVEVNFEREDKALAMLANIPIVAVNRPGGSDAPPAAAEPPQPAVNAEATVAPAQDVADVMGAPNVTSPGAEAATATPAPPPVRRRRKKKSHANGQMQGPAKTRTSPAF